MPLHIFCEHLLFEYTDSTLLSLCATVFIHFTSMFVPKILALCAPMLNRNTEFWRKGKNSFILCQAKREDSWLGPQELCSLSRG